MRTLRREIALRVAMLGAFPFPLAQGSQIYVRDQALALGRAGADVTLFCYGRGVGPIPAELAVEQIPHALSPRSRRSGPSLSKPIADAALAAAYVTAHRRQPFDVALAHNVEAAAVALAARPLIRVPVIYVAHTLMGGELSSYRPGGVFAKNALDRLGRGIDRWIASHSSAVIALCSAAARELGISAKGPVALIPPGLDPSSPPAAQQIASTCARFGLAPDRYVVYAGNLDGYQDLCVLEEISRRLSDLRVVVATHEASAERVGARGLRILCVDADEARALTFGALAALLPRRLPGGFPIKLLNYMAAARPIVARRGIASGLEHGHSAWLVSPDAAAEEFVSAVETLATRPKLRARLGGGAFEHLETHHRWNEIAAQTLAFVCDVGILGRNSP